ncbi:DNA methyltransferase, partial [Amedibacillus dolichus]|uniref:DNA methyltransferase n=1 Tax=Amedibacillus dolichus TaxID=31971 RepID=UPI00242D4C50
IVKQLFRVMKAGRLVSIHCMDLPTTKASDGFIGLRDFPGILIKLFQDCGFYYHSRVTIWKDPVVAMQRTKALGLLHKQIKKDSSMCRQGIADYIITMRKPGDNENPITHTNETFPVEQWQQYASPVWMDIQQGNTLNRTSAREERDEKHICPLQLDVIARCIELWSNEGDTIFTPFLGIGSEAYQSLKMHRKAIGIELKESYFRQAVKNCYRATTCEEQINLFEGL